jgi:glycine cleavage system transcriptional repressor
VTRVVADAGGNVTDLTTRLVGELYVLVAEVDLPPSVDVDALAQRLRAVADELGVDVSLRTSDPDVL